MYVLYVRGGKELQVVEELRRKNITAYKRLPNKSRS